MPGIEAMWTESCKHKIKQMQEVWLSEGGHVWCMGGEAAEAEEIGCWCPGVLCQGVGESS